MAENKTKPVKASVDAFLKKVVDAKRREDCSVIVAMMKKATGEEPVMWGPSIVGFGSYHYVYESGREGDAPLVGFSPRKQDLVFYLSAEFDGRADLVKKLGKCKEAKACLYIKKLQDVDPKVLETMVSRSYKHRLKKG